MRRAISTAMPARRRNGAAETRLPKARSHAPTSATRIHQPRPEHGRAMAGALARSVITSAVASGVTAAALMALGRHERRGGALTSAFAAAFDYLVVPRRLSPGWELALSRKAMTGAFAAMALGLATGAAAARMRR